MFLFLSEVSHNSRFVPMISDSPGGPVPLVGLVQSSEVFSAAACAAMRGLVFADTGSWGWERIFVRCRGCGGGRGRRPRRGLRACRGASIVGSESM